MLPIQITIRHVVVSPALERTIRKRAEKLSRFYRRIISCHIVIEVAQNHKHQGKLFNVRIDLSVPKKELVVTHKYNQDIHIAVRAAFEAIERQLEEHARKRHGRIKTHQGVMRGHVARILLAEGYGFIKGIDGNEYYFSITNVHYPQFEQLTIGDAVEYFMEEVSEGRQAHHVVKKERRQRLEAAIAVA